MHQKLLMMKQIKLGSIGYDVIKCCEQCSNCKTCVWIWIILRPLFWERPNILRALPYRKYC